MARRGGVHSFSPYWSVKESKLSNPETIVTYGINGFNVSGKRRSITVPNLDSVPVIEICGMEVFLLFTKQLSFETKVNE